MAQTIDAFTSDDGAVGVRLVGDGSGDKNQEMMRRLAELYGDPSLALHADPGTAESNDNDGTSPIVRALRSKISIRTNVDGDNVVRLLGDAMSAAGIAVGSNEYTAALDSVNFQIAHRNFGGASVVANTKRLELLAVLESGSVSTEK